MRGKTMQNDMRIVRASVSDADAIYGLYHALIDMPYSTWDEEYPTREIVQEDLEQHTVLVMRNEADEIVAAIAIWHEKEFADAAKWYEDVTRWAMLSRLGVRRDQQGKGIAKKMLIAAMDAARADGCEAVQFLVAKSNPIAQRAYAPLGFDVCGEAEMWEEQWLCYQKRL